MNKNLDHLFEQARKSMQSEMPLEEVQQLIHGQASPSLWTNQKIWIMSTSILGILTIGIVCWFNSYNHPTPTTATTIPKENPSFAQQAKSSEQHTIVLQDAVPDNIPLPILNKENITPNALTLAAVENDNSKTNSVAKKASKLDSLGPKKTFTEYTLEIKKENSEEEIKKLKAELSNYGIHMEVKILNYDTDNKIKRFKGQFKTDSLFCGSTMNDYEFDISGAFKSMEFIFRVADNKNLKYLKIQSDNFEETIECYDDEVISSSQEARKISRQMHEEMAKTQEKMANAQQEMARFQEEIARLQRENHTKNKIKRLEQLGLTNWDEIDKNIKTAIEHIEIKLEDIDDDIVKSLKNKKIIILDQDFKGDLKILQKDLAKIRIDIEGEVNDQVKTYRLKHNEEIKHDFPTKNKDVFILEKFLETSTPKEQTAEELKEEATAMEEAAKELKRVAKEKRKEAKKKAKNK